MALALINDTTLMELSMKNLMQLVKNLDKKQLGATMVEYALMLALIAIVSIVMITGVGQQTNTTFSVINSALESANGNG
jgi:pilus assembly protein Flp/PilA